MTVTCMGEAELARVIGEYTGVTERLKRSHELLCGEVARLRRELAEKNQELARRERLSALGEMAAGVAHEIRNPLGGIGLYASLLEKDLADRPEQLELARQISNGVRNLAGIVSDILAFGSEVKLKRRRIALADVLDGAMTQVSSQIEGLEARVEVDLRLARIEASCDAGQIERVFVNLLRNALDAAGRGGRVRVRAGENRSAASMAVVVIEDNGPGIAAQNLDRVFNPFFTTKDKGTGLGLAIVHRIVEAHGGSVVAGNRKGGGAAIVLQLPGVQAEPEDNAAMAAAGVNPGVPCKGVGV